MDATATETEPSYVAFRRKALEIAATMVREGPPIDLEAVDHTTPEGLAKAIAVVFSAYDWTIASNGELCGLVAGDQGYTTTGIYPDKVRVPA